jgi:diguanylate cyclase (GGDEF)-like protein
MFDVDNFKHINDAFGHRTGDDVLVEISRTCRADLREGDILARLGGDEFVILLPGMTLADAEPVANLLRLRIAQNIQDRMNVSASISGGLSAFRLSDVQCEDVLKRTDDALYLSKHKGRNCITAEHPEIAGQKRAVGV